MTARISPITPEEPIDNQRARAAIQIQKRVRGREARKEVRRAQQSQTQRGRLFSRKLSFTFFKGVEQVDDEEDPIKVGDLTYEFKITRKQTYVVSWCPVGDKLEMYVSEERIAETAEKAKSQRRKVGPEAGGCCDLFAYPTLTFIAEGNVVLACAASGEHLDFLNQLMRQILDNVMQPQAGIRTFCETFRPAR